MLTSEFQLPACVCVPGGAGRKRESLLANGQRPVLLHRQLTGDLLVRPPSTMSVTPVKTVDRRLSAELRTQLERTRRTRFGDELKVSLALLVVIAVFVVSWAPISLVNAVETFQLATIPRPVERPPSTVDRPVYWSRYLSCSSSWKVLADPCRHNALSAQQQVITDRIFAQRFCRQWHPWTDQSWRRGQWNVPQSVCCSYNPPSTHSSTVSWIATSEKSSRTCYVSVWPDDEPLLATLLMSASIKQVKAHFVLHRKRGRQYFTLTLLKLDRFQ